VITSRPIAARPQPATMSQAGGRRRCGLGAGPGGATVSVSDGAALDSAGGFTAAPGTVRERLQVGQQKLLPASAESSVSCRPQRQVTVMAAMKSNPPSPPDARRQKHQFPSYDYARLQPSVERKSGDRALY
jgi:hypothetical protein